MKKIETITYSVWTERIQTPSINLYSACKG